VLGHFYNIVVGAQRVRCRSALEIVREELMPVRIDAAPDAIVVMMNPGSSQPTDSVPEEVELTRFLLTLKLVATKPDTTQYQIMRLMHYCGWDHVRVLNLSDLREASSASFVKCSDSWDHVPVRSWPLFKARHVLRTLLTAEKRSITT
jgi:hypothetical protein